MYHMHKFHEMVLCLKFGDAVETLLAHAELSRPVPAPSEPLLLTS